MFGLTSSITLNTLGPTGPIGPVGHVGLAGIDPNKKLITIFCKKDYGFIKSGQYVNVFSTEIMHFTPSPAHTFLSLQSKDNKMSFHINEEEADEYFIWRSGDLREHKLEILKLHENTDLK